MKNNYSPDILNCLANLSSDEVFTSPELANRMLDLLPQELFRSSKTRFLDPCSKSGVFLREIAKRLLVGLEQQIPDLQQRIDHIMTKQVFGIACTDLTAEMSRRTLYCTKKANGEYSVTAAFLDEQGNLRYDRSKHIWEGEKCKYCGANRAQYDRTGTSENYAYPFIHKNFNEIFKNMQFDVIIGNPPYQLDDGGNGASAGAMYHKFVLQSILLSPRYLCMIIPARWYAGGKGLDEFRNKMLTDTRLREIHDYNNASECFPGVEIKGGVCYFLWNRDNMGLCKVVTHRDGVIESEMTRPLLEKGLDVFIRHNRAIEIIKKVRKFNEKSFSNIVSSRKPFGFASNFSNFYSDKKDQSSVVIYANKRRGFVDKNQIEKNIGWVDMYKLLVPEAIGAGDMTKDWIKPIQVAGNVCCTETYIVIGPFQDENTMKNVYSYTQTKFFHLLLGLKKITQHTTQKVYELIPLQDFSHPWTDEMLYKKYNLDKDEIAFIESMIRPME